MGSAVRWAVLGLAAGLAWGCGGADGGGDAGGVPDVPGEATAVDAATPDAVDDVRGPLPVCACPQVPASKACRSCSSLDDGCEERNGTPYALRCVLGKGCLEAENCNQGGEAIECHEGVCFHVDPGPDLAGHEPEPEVVEVAEPDLVKPGSKQVGESCADYVECADGMSCVSGQYTQAHCNPMCATVDDCNAAYPGGNAQCAALSGGSVCIWMCGQFGGGATCPGDLDCDGATCG